VTISQMPRVYKVFAFVIYCPGLCLRSALSLKKYLKRLYGDFVAVEKVAMKEYPWEGAFVSQCVAAFVLLSNAQELSTSESQCRRSFSEGPCSLLTVFG
jgi:hypothetical protein